MKISGDGRTARAKGSLDQRKQRRDGFLDAAAEVFSDHGLRDATMDQVAEKLDLSKVILYRHFASKEDLIHSVLEQIAGRLIALDAGASSDTGKQGAATLRLARNNRAGFLLLVRDARNDPIFGAHYQQVHDAISERLHSLMLSEGMDPLMARMCAEAYTDTCINGVLNWLLYADPDRDAEYPQWLAAGVMGMCQAWRSRAASPTGFAPAQTQGSEPEESAQNFGEGS